MELKNKEELRSEILQSWLQSAWVYPFQGPDDRTYLRLTPGGRLKMRRRIGELESVLGVEGTELARQEQAGTLPRRARQARARDDGPGVRHRAALDPESRRHPRNPSGDAGGTGFLRTRLLDLVVWSREHR